MGVASQRLAKKKHTVAGRGLVLFLHAEFCRAWAFMLDSKKCLAGDMMAGCTLFGIATAATRTLCFDSLSSNKTADWSTALSTTVCQRCTVHHLSSHAGRM
uniref:Uncharacterized protein n=1 Tax=Chlamydomonas euryale TaxID=1486919 RepID=A0A7R9Z6J1_9CHLO|mmetsp:Transcript_6863/g.21092  ORF Transcript_6863/g.21092 Transcript_6863/m.21092 type:complete len:101 (+) Transcript_6863:218-520(+)|eukprot:354411-Chlamydomonas_euryale.AAC.26